MPTGWYTRRRTENRFLPESAQLYGQMAVEWLTWEAERTGLSVRHQVNGREKRNGKYRVDGRCSERRTAYQIQGCYYHCCPCTRQEVNAANGKSMSELLDETLDLRLPAKLCQGRRDMGMSVERRKKRCGRETVPRRRVSWSSSTIRAYDATSDIDRRASRYPVRYDRVLSSRTG